MWQLCFKKFLKVGSKFSTVPPVVINSVTALFFKNKHRCGSCNQFVATIIFAYTGVCY